MGLLERGEHLATLVDRFGEASDAGRLVLVTGEAGAGKSALVQEFLARHVDRRRVLFGRCDDLFAARPLGPLADMVRDRPGPLSQALAAGDQTGVFDTFLAELAPHRDPVVVVLEDLQWADEATLDLVRFVARRLDALSCLVLATYRSDLAKDHPLRRVAGGLVGPLVTRVHLPPLSLEAVRTLAAGTGVDAESLHARTGGNPFFVTELLAGEAGALPVTVRDTVLARASSLSGPARDALDAAAVLGREVPPDVIAAVGDCDTTALDECVRAGMLVIDGRHVDFRHDLAREAIEEALTPLRRRQLHARALDALGRDADIVRRAHHAIEAGDASAVLDLAARAADQCVALGAHREAAALYGSALAHADGADRATRRRLLEARAFECERVDQMREAFAAAEELVKLLDDGSDERALAMWECRVGGWFCNEGRTAETWRTLRRAVARLEQLGESAELADALAMLAGLHMVTGEHLDAIAVGRRAQAVAERCGAEDLAVKAMDTYGTSMATAGDEAGYGVLNEALDRAKRAGVYREVARITNNWASALLNSYNPRPALSLLDLGIATATEHELVTYLNCLLATRADARFRLGRWDDAAADVQTLLGAADLSTTNRSCTIHRLAQLRTRRGDPDAAAARDEALGLARLVAERQSLHPNHIMRAEAAWLAGDRSRAACEVHDAVALWSANFEAWPLGELALWAHRAGVDWEPPIPVPEPFALMLAGDARAAADAWDARECAYEAADALADSVDAGDLREALDRLTALGARPRARLVTRRLRELGVRDLPRGPRASTRANPAGLTAREVEVAALLVQGLANSEIADTLVLSPKTVDHHVSAVLTKLAVPSRRHVAKAAAAVGLALPV